MYEHGISHLKHHLPHIYGRDQVLQYGVVNLYKKSEKKNGVVRYCNKHQCRICEKKCVNVKGAIPYKEVDFSKRSRLKMKK